MPPDLPNLCSSSTVNVSSSETELPAADGGDLEAHLQQVQRLRGEIEHLRTAISDQFADQVASNATCLVQWMVNTSIVSTLKAVLATDFNVTVHMDDSSL